MWLDPDCLEEFCGILPYSYFDRQIKCFLCYNGSICIPEFEEIFECFGINAEDIKKHLQIANFATKTHVKIASTANT